MKSKIGNETNHLELQINALLTEYSTLSEEYRLLKRTSIQIVTVLIGGVVALLGYTLETGNYQIILVFPPFISLVGIFFLTSTTEVVSIRALLIIIEQRINTLTSGDIERYLSANYVLFWRSDKNMRYPYHNLDLKLKRSRPVVYAVTDTIFYLFYLYCLLFSVIWLWNQNFTILLYSISGMIIATIYLAIFFVVPTLLIILTFKLRNNIIQDMKKEMTELSKSTKQR